MTKKEFETNNWKTDKFKYVRGEKKHWYTLSCLWIVRQFNCNGLTYNEAADNILRVATTTTLGACRIYIVLIVYSTQSGVLVENSV